MCSFYPLSEVLRLFFNIHLLYPPRQRHRRRIYAVGVVDRQRPSLRVPKEAGGRIGRGRGKYDADRAAGTSVQSGTAGTRIGC